MNISTKGRYGIRMLVDLAQHKDAGLVQIKDLAQRQDITIKYAEQIISLLNKNRFVRSVRGAQGGYEIIGNAKDYTIYDILTKIEGDLSVVDCVNDETYCNRTSACASRNLWVGLNTVIKDYLSNITLQDLVDQTINTSDLYSI